MRKSRSPDHILQGLRMLVSSGALWCALGGLATTWVTSIQATTPSAEEFVRELESSYRDVRTLRAEFTQTYDWQGRTRVESGTVYFERGGKMRWDYRQPEQKLFLSDGKKLWLYVPAEKQLTRSPIKTSEDIRAPFRLLLSRVNLRKVFSKIEFADQTQGRSPDGRVLRAFPRRANQDAYRQVLIEVSASFDIRRLVIFYPDRGTMEFMFSRIKQNVSVSPDLFSFTPPPGTEVIDHR